MFRISSPRDNHISFVESNHTYLVHQKVYPSVTTLIHHHFPKFDADQVIEKMRRSKTWSSSQYFGMTNNEIKACWEKNRDSSSSCGSDLHQKIENFYNEMIQNHLDDKRDYLYSKYHDEEMKRFIDFDLTYKLVPLRTEWRVYSEDYHIAGSIDMIFKGDQPNTIKVFDWKRSKEIKMNNRFEKGFYPLQDLDHCNYQHYSIQLNTYKFILERHYDVKVDEMALIVLHPNNPSFVKIPVPDLQDKIKLMLEHHISKSS
jgi:ATP-dependent exoDNAse (exonuclease V) beta subunit